MYRKKAKDRLKKEKKERNNELLRNTDSFCRLAPRHVTLCHTTVRHARLLDDGFRGRVGRMVEGREREREREDVDRIGQDSKPGFRHFNVFCGRMDVYGGVRVGKRV